jgi:uncharacterized protein YjbI with pentapeptide repeats
MKIQSKGLLSRALVFLCLLAPFRASAQRAFSISLTPTYDGAVAISWKAQSATPLGDLFIVPQFQLERSADLRTWEPVGNTISPNLNEIVTVIDPQGSFSFYRVASIISTEYAQLSHGVLDSGGLDGADFLGADLFGASLMSASLRGANLSGTDLRSANFSGSDLSGAKVFGVLGDSATFDFAEMAGIDGAFADFENASFFVADLTGADLSFAILAGAGFDFASWNRVTMDANTLIDPKPKLIWEIVNHGAVSSNLMNLDLSLATFTNVSFHAAKLNGSDLSASDFRLADLRVANLTGANTRFIDLRGTLLDATTTIDAKSRLVWQILNNGGANQDFHGANLATTWLIGANLVGANLTNTLFTTSVLEEVNFGAANLTRANLNNADIFSGTLTNANLTQAQFRFSDLTDANLRHAITNGADFTGATFSNTIMPDGSIRNF